jgi:hypothetical protein
MNDEFSIGLRGSSSLSAERVCDGKTYDEELDSIASVLFDVCDALAEIGEIHFSVGGFGQRDWAASVRTDLCVALEQMPDISRALARGEGFELDFYEQGLERTVRFARRGSELTVACVSRNPRWAPEPASIEMRVLDFEDMLTALLEEFGRLARAVCPRQAAHPWFLEWYSTAIAFRSSGNQQGTG